MRLQHPAAPRSAPAEFCVRPAQLLGIGIGLGRARGIGNGGVVEIIQLGARSQPASKLSRWRDWYSVSRSSSVHRWSVLPMRRNAPLGRPVALK
jgi:hypothetical protein